MYFKKKCDPLFTDDPDFEVAIPDSLKEPEPVPEPAAPAAAASKPKHVRHAYLA